MSRHGLDGHPDRDGRLPRRTPGAGDVANGIGDGGDGGVGDGGIRGCGVECFPAGGDACHPPVRRRNVRHDFEAVAQKIRADMGRFASPDLIESALNQIRAKL